MGLLSKAIGGLASKFKDKISQGIQGAKRFAGNAWETAKQGLTKAKDFIYDHREAIGGALNAAAPFIGAINPALGIAASTGGSFLQRLKPGPVKDRLKKLVDEDNGPNNITVDSGAQQAVDRRRALSTPTPRKRKKAKLSTQE